MTITVMTVFKNQIFQSLIESILYINIYILIYNIKYLLTNHNLQKHVFSKQNCHNCNCHNCHFVSNYSPFFLAIPKKLAIWLREDESGVLAVATLREEGARVYGYI